MTKIARNFFWVISYSIQEELFLNILILRKTYTYIIIRRLISNNYIPLSRIQIILIIESNVDESTALVVVRHYSISTARGPDSTAEDSTAEDSTAEINLTNNYDSIAEFFSQNADSTACGF